MNFEEKLDLIIESVLAEAALKVDQERLHNNLKKDISTQGIANAIAIEIVGGRADEAIAVLIKNDPDAYNRTLMAGVKVISGFIGKETLKKFGVNETEAGQLVASVDQIIKKYAGGASKGVSVKPEDPKDDDSPEPGLKKGKLRLPK